MVKIENYEGPHMQFSPVSCYFLSFRSKYSRLRNLI